MTDALLMEDAMHNTHTPGPWVVEASEYGSLITKDGKSMVAVWPEGLGGPTFPHEANARLIAAAPELLEALKACAAVCAGEIVNKSGLTFALELARAAIAKATGGQL